MTHSSRKGTGLHVDELLECLSDIPDIFRVDVHCDVGNKAHPAGSRIHDHSLPGLAHNKDTLLLYGPFVMRNFFRSTMSVLWSNSPIDFSKSIKKTTSPTFPSLETIR